MFCQNLLRWIQKLPTLDLVNDCSYFVTGFFEVISISSLHIYHSALPLSPKTSFVQELYKSHAHPFFRIVHGLQTSWMPSIATIKFPNSLEAAVWSPCSKFIAIHLGGISPVIEILDAMTLM